MYIDFIVIDVNNDVGTDRVQIASACFSKFFGTNGFRNMFFYFGSGETKRRDSDADFHFRHVTFELQVLICFPISKEEERCHWKLDVATPGKTLRQL